MTITVPLPYPDFAEAKVYADLHGMETAEVVVRLALRKLLETDPRCAAVVVAEQKAKREARVAELAKYPMDSENGTL